MNSLSILFWVRASQSNKKGLSPLMLRLTLPNDDVSDFSTGNAVDAKLWNPDKKRIIGRSDDADRINQYITRSTTKIQNIYDDLEKEERPISSEIIKNIFQGKTVLKITLLGAIEDHNLAAQTAIDKQKNPNKKSGMEGTLKIFKNMKSKVVKFLDVKLKRKDVFITEVNHGFIEDFRTWMEQSGHHREGGLSTDTTTGHLKKLDKITGDLFKRGHIKADPFIDVRLSWEDPTAEGLDEGELEAFEKCQLRLQRLIKVLDRFIVGCYTGMAHSDISKVSRTDLIKNFADDGQWIKAIRTKTGEYCKIPVLPPVQTIIDKYWNDQGCIASNKLFPTVGLNSCNDYLKEIAVFAGVNKNVTTHTARHTFAQMAMDLGVNIEAVAEILGHADSKTTRSIYAKASHKFVAAEIKNLTDKKFPQMKVVEGTKNVG